MMSLFRTLQREVQAWRDCDYQCTEYPELREILEYQKNEEETLRFLRTPQFESIETYLYVRYVLKTPHVRALYKRLFRDDTEKLFKALGITHIPHDALPYVNADEVLDGIKNNRDGIVQKHQYHALQEALAIDYASYILALVMGAGKTILIGTIIGIEFAIALSHEERGDGENALVMKNALITAKGTTIIESLREISHMDFSQILPPRLYRKFAPNVKIHYTADNDKACDGVLEGSSYNIVITNNEKIILKNISVQGSSLKLIQKAQEKELHANDRLQRIRSLPQLAIFSDEAHNTYGQKIGKELKRVRETINNIHRNKSLVCVVNTTGTPYYQKQTLKEVIYWYSLEQGIKDNILKSIENNIVSYSFEKESENEIIIQVVEDFFTFYENTKLETGQQAKIAFYFKTIAHLEESKKVIEKTLLRLSLSPTLIVVNTGESRLKEIEEFNALNNLTSQKRIILLVGKGTEGWNCPSLFATALIKEQTTSSTFVLQASSRCLRQVKNNSMPAKMYLSSKNTTILDKELQSTFGISVNEMNSTSQQKEVFKEAIIRKTDIPKLIMKKKIRQVKRKSNQEILRLSLHIPEVKSCATFTHRYRLENGQLKESDTGETMPTHIAYGGAYNVAIKLAENYHIEHMPLVSALKQLYPHGAIPIHHVDALSKQIEEQVNEYEIVEEVITQALAIIKLKDAQGNFNFEVNEKGYFYHTIRYKEKTLRERLITDYADDGYKNNKHDIGFHLSKYDFDSTLEKNFFDKLFNILQVDKREVEDIYFTGSLTDTQKTDIYFEYQTESGRFAPYYPDFVIRKTDETFLIVEIKSTRDKDLPDVRAKEKAVKTIEALNTDIFKYVIVFSDDENIAYNNIGWDDITDWIDAKFS